MEKDYKENKHYVDHYIKVPLTDHQKEALTSFTFNNGAGRLRDSTLAKRLNNGEDPNKVAKEEMPKYSIAKGKHYKGLDDRRDKEIEHFSTPDDDCDAKK